MKNSLKIRAKIFQDRFIYGLAFFIPLGYNRPVRERHCEEFTTKQSRKGVFFMAIYGYHRTSTTEQLLDRGIKAISDFCEKNNLTLDEMFTDRQTGKNFNRPDYITLKRMAKKPGDIIIASELDRLGRNKEETLKELRHFKSLGVRLMILEIPTTLVDYSVMDDAMSNMILETVNNMLIEMYATFAHAEMLKREKRQREGIQAMKDRGEWDDTADRKPWPSKSLRRNTKKSWTAYSGRSIA